MIKLLSAELVNKIAAGEVVERPSSVLKELLENAIDAGATEVVVKLEGGGARLIEVSDNGCGISRTDAELAFTQHATSKIFTVDDLSNIMTLGFRGEALASISSVSDTTMHTFDGANEPVEVTEDNGVMKSKLAQARSRGTTIAVRNLFGKIPARRKFMRSEQTEYKNCFETLSAISLSNPHINFSLYKDDKKVLDLHTSSLSERISALFNLSQTDLIEINASNPHAQITGYIGHPKLAKQNTSTQFIFINSRVIKDKLIAKAIRDGIGSAVMPGLQPVYFIFIKINPELVDVNTHPRKLEVKFANPGDMFSFVRSAVSKSAEMQLRSSAEEISVSWAPISTPQTTSNQHHTTSFKRQSDSGYTPSFMPTTFSEKLSDEIEHDDQKTFQIFNTYIIFERDQKLMIVDQHAAAERIKYEQLAETFRANQRIDSQQLLAPQELPLTTFSSDLLKEVTPKLRSYGFELTFEGSKAFLNAVPLLINTTNEVDLLLEIIEELIDTDSQSDKPLEIAQDEIITKIACHNSIRAGRAMHQAESKQLISDLLRCKLPYSCPHGRPIIWELTKYEIERQFKRVV